MAHGGGPAGGQSAAHCMERFGQDVLGYRQGSVAGKEGIQVDHRGLRSFVVEALTHFDGASPGPYG